MNNYPSLLSDIFDRHVAAPALSLEDEHAAILAAQGGDETATVLLMYIYGPALRGAAHRALLPLGHGVSRDTLDEIRSVVVLALLEVLHEFDTAQAPVRLAARLKVRLPGKLEEAGWGSGPSPFTVPSRTLRRFYGLMAEAGQDLDVALSLAKAHSMAPDTVRAVYAALRESGSYDALSAEDDGEEGLDDALSYAFPIGAEELDEILAAEERHLAETALASLEPKAERVVRMAYGFTEAEPVPDGRIASRMGTSRTTVRRIRNDALDTMRAALGVAA